MTPQMTFQAIYNSPWHDTVLFLSAGAVVLVALARKLPFLSGWLMLFAVEIMADAYLNGAWSPYRLTHREAPALVPVAFVILGDARYFLAAERYLRAPSPHAPTPPAALWAGMAWAFIVPVLTYGAMRLLPAVFSDPRRFYLTYELALFALALSWRLVVLPRRGGHVPPDTLRWLRVLTDFILVQYGLWALADVLILSVGDLGYGLRLVPNVMYYALFLPFAFTRAPTGIRPGTEVPSA